MKNDRTLKACSKNIMAVRDALEIFSGKWKIPIIGALIFFKEAQFKDLQRIVGNITPKMLSKELKDLEMNHLVSREVHDTRPVTVLYKITPHGESCESVIKSLHDWGVHHRNEIIK